MSGTTRVCRIFWISVCLAGGAAAQVNAPATSVLGSESEGLAEIVVTATKREESVDTIPLTITAISGDNLLQKRIFDPSDLVTVVPGLNYTEANYATPVYTIRGVGFYDTSVGSKSTVAIYLDEQPYPFSSLSRGASLDLERVEVLKGPQGILFGENSTGGAINFIAAKPTPDFQTGFDLDLGNYNTINFGGFVSGPIAETLTGRVAVRTEQSGAYQQSYTQRLQLGGKDFTDFRVLLDWKPAERFKAEFGVNGFIDKSWNPAAQFISFAPSPAIALYVPQLSTYPTSPQNDRAADWSPALPLKRDVKMVQTNARLDFNAFDELNLTSLTSYDTFGNTGVADLDGVSFGNFNDIEDVHVHSFNQELRAGGLLFDKLNYLVGGNYESSQVNQTDLNQFPQSTSAHSLAFLGTPPLQDGGEFADQHFSTTAGFLNVDYQLPAAITVHGGARYTKTDVQFSGCSFSPADNGIGDSLTLLTDIIRGGAGLGPISPILPGGCITLSPALVPGVVNKSLDQNNVSWRGALDWQPAENSLLYVSATKGYKAGSFPLLGATSSFQYNPVVQESVLDYESGFKLGLFERKIQFNGAIFYYDYSNKQFKGKILGNPNIFGPLDTLVNIPHSHLFGGEISLDWKPVRDLTIGVAGTYVETKIANTTVLSQLGTEENLAGHPFPYTPKFQVSADVEYVRPINGRYNAFIGSNATFQSKTNAVLENDPLFQIDSYSLVDARLGIETSDGRLRVGLWGRNITDRYYWTNTTRIVDTIVRFAGEPATYGLSLNYRYK